MIDEERCANESLPRSIYEKIEISVVELFRELLINEFPIDPFDIVRKKGWALIPYSKLDEMKLDAIREVGQSGISLRKGNGGNYRIYYDDSHPGVRQRFTIMHEIGHIVLDHKESSEYAEKCANYFAAYALAPTPMIGIFNCEDYIDVAKRFVVSRESADISFARYMRWLKLPIGLKSYEKDLIVFFK